MIQLNQLQDNILKCLILDKYKLSRYQLIRESQ